MNRIRSMARREFRSFFTSPIAYVFLAAFVGAALFTFFNHNTFFARGQADLRGLFSSIPFLFLLLVPALTMRLWAEEEKQGTIEILLTLPTRDHELVAGKFLASWYLLGIGLALTLPLAFLVAALGNLDWGPVIGGYLGALLLGAAYLAVGQFVSAITENQILAFILALFVCMILWGLGTDAFTSLFPDRIAAVLLALGTGSRFESIARGVIDLRDLLYYVSLTVFFLMLCVGALRVKRWTWRGVAMNRNTRIRELVIVVLLVGANLLALNYLLAGWASARVDLTEEGLYSITGSTRRILGNLDEEVTILGYFSDRTHPKLAPLIPEIADLLDEYRAVSRGKVNIEFLDPSADDDVAQEAADRYGVQSTPFRLSSKSEVGIVNAYFALVIRYGDQYERYSFQDLIKVEPLPGDDIEVRLRNLEYDLTRAIKKVVYGFQATGDLFDRIEEPVTLIAVVSPSTLPEMFAEVPDALRKAAEELGQAAGDKFVYRELDPATDEAARSEAEMEWGLSPMSLGLFSDQSFYLYGLLRIGGRYEQLVLTDEGISAASIREGIENSLRRNTPGFLKTVGVFTSAPMQIPPEIRMQMNLPPQAPPEFEEVKRFLGDEYTVRDVKLDAEGVPTDVDVLLVLKPENLSEWEIFNLDQYLMRGGRMIVCSGNYSANFSGAGLSVAPVETGLNEWLAHHGVTIEKTMVLDDRNQPLPIPEIRSTPLGNMRTWTLAPYPYLVQVRDEGFLDANITSTLDAVGIYWGSPLKIDGTAEEVEVRELLRSSERSWTDSDTSQVGFVDYTVPEEGLAPQLLSVALNGKFSSYYRDRPVPDSLAPTPTDLTEPAAAPDDPETDAPSDVRNVALTTSPETRLVVIGDAAFLSDFVARTIGPNDGGFFVENLTFLKNVIDWTNLDSDMLEIRSRGLVSRDLARLSPRRQLLVEVIAYAMTLILLAAIAVHMRWRRERQPGVGLGPVRPPRAASGEAG